MYSIDIKNYIDYGPNGTNTTGVYTTAWNPVYSIPITDPNSAFIDPVVKTEMGKAGSFEFTVLPGHPLYKSWCQMKTLLRVKYGDIILFRGRVLTIDEGLKGARKIHCEGDLAFLLDSQQEMTHEEKREEINIGRYIRNILHAHNEQMAQLNSFTSSDSGESAYQEGSIDPNDDALYYLEDDADKQFLVGQVPGDAEAPHSGGYTEDWVKSGMKVRPTKQKKKWGSKNWETSMAALEALQKEYGGYFRVRNEVLSTGKERHYLDWLKNYFRHESGSSEANSTPIQIASNLIDINSTSEVDNIFTVFVPVGSKNGKELYLDGYVHKWKDDGGTQHSLPAWSTKYITVPQLAELSGDISQKPIKTSHLTRDFHTVQDYSDAINRYGVIYKTQKFDNADTQDKLWDYAIDWMLDNYIGGLQSFNVTALDLYHYNPTIYQDQYLSGDRIKIVYPNPETMTGNSAPTNISLWRVILSIEYHLHNPEKNTYSIGIPNTQISKTYGTSSKSKSKSSGKPDPNTDVVNEAKADLGEVDETLWSIVFNSYFNHDMYADLDPEQNKAILKGHYLFLKQAQDNPKGSAGLLLDGLNGNIQFDITNPQDEKKALKRAEMTPGGIKYLRYLTESGETRTITGTNIIGADGKMLASQIMLGKDAEGNTVGLNLDGLKGIFELFGVNGNPDDNPLKSIEMDGFKQFLKFFSKPDPKTRKQEETISTDGEKGYLRAGRKEVVKDSQGHTVMIPDPDDPEKEIPLTRWKVTLAEPIPYVDSEGKVKYTPSGLVGASDFFLTEVPSFKTTFAFIGTAVIPELYSAKAKIDNLTGNTYVADTFVRADYLFSNHCTSNDFYSATGFTLLHGEGTRGNNLDQCFVDVDEPTVDPTTGEVEFVFHRAKHGAAEKKITFNQASTQFYKDGVEAAWDEAAGLVVLPAKVTTGEVSSFSFSYPLKTATSSGEVRGQDTKTYSLRVENNDAYISIYDATTQTYTNYAHVIHGKYNAGFDYASGRVTLPIAHTANSDKTSVSFSYPVTTTTAGVTTRGQRTSSYTLRYDSGKIYLSIANSGGTFTNYARISDANLISENIVSGKTIFGVTGTATGTDRYDEGYENGGKSARMIGENYATAKYRPHWGDITEYNAAPGHTTLSAVTGDNADHYLLITAGYQDQEGHDVAVRTRGIKFKINGSGDTYTPYTFVRAYDDTDDYVYYGKFYDENGKALTGDSYYWYGHKQAFGTTQQATFYRKNL